MTQHAVITLSNTNPTRLTPAGMHSGLDITIQNVSDEGYVYLGDSTVTTSNYGYRISPNNAISFELPEKDTMYAIGSENGVQIAVIKTNLEK